jgi:hypothetical protein
LGHDDQSRKVYPLIFDTGAGKSFIYSPLPAEEQISDDADTDSSPEDLYGSRILIASNKDGFVPQDRDLLIDAEVDLVFGVQGMQEAVGISHGSTAMIQIINTRLQDAYAHPEDVLLTHVKHDEDIGHGILAASPQSALAMNAKFFTLVPVKLEERPIAIHQSPLVGHLFIGERDEGELMNKGHCRSRFVHCEMDTSNGDEFWIVAGSAMVETRANGPVYDRHPLRWVVDTGSGADDAPHFVDESTYADLVAEITRLGFTVKPLRADIKTRIIGCDRSKILEFPNLVLSVIGREGRLSVRLGPSQYIFFPITNQDSCFLNVKPMGMGIDGARLLGMGFLSHTVTIFDRELGQVSFCKQH